ncbi:DUF3817 domain-containing protein [Arthrobacter sp. ATA002]|uniref:DUF3817 domain-containing protein n=1 Tax=Arthrobacter sp. ATA002 TaxID=2991715 RepID=UPI0022A772A9|nr:DUF3817 domain-containing protein [Arthrobacter sp. ATA002]WAP52613.1 DUF3817 domain-containing protein [Arthrobacter sp. ATA002]
MSDRAQAPTEAPAATKKPRRKKRRFGGTHAQIRSALKFYKVLSYFTGTLLLALVVQMIVKYGFGTEIYIGDFNVSVMVLIVHGWVYVAYLLSDFQLWRLMRWPFSKFLLIALGGCVPFLSFIVEGRTHKQVVAELAAHPEAVKRY